MGFQRWWQVVTEAALHIHLSSGEWGCAALGLLRQ